MKGALKVSELKRILSKCPDCEVWIVLETGSSFPLTHLTLQTFETVSDTDDHTALTRVNLESRRQIEIPIDMREKKKP